MESTLEKSNKKALEIVEVSDGYSMTEVLTKFLYVPNESVRQKVVSQIVKYYERKFAKQETKAKFYVAKRRDEVVGFVFCQVDEKYKSYGMKCPTMF